MEEQEHIYVLIVKKKRIAVRVRKSIRLTTSLKSGKNILTDCQQKKTYPLKPAIKTAFR